MKHPLLETAAHCQLSFVHLLSELLHFPVHCKTQGPHSQPPKGITKKQPTIITKKRRKHFFFPKYTHTNTHFGSHVFSPLTVNPANAATCGAKGKEGPKLRLQQGDGRVERSCLTMPPGELHPRKCTTPGALMHLRLHRFVTLKVERTRRTT